jgi:hypothetical protein
MAGHQIISFRAHERAPNLILERRGLARPIAGRFGSGASTGARTVDAVQLYLKLLQA